MEKPNTKVITGKVRLSYANIWTPKAVNDSPDKKYSVSLIIPKTDKKTIASIHKAVDEAKQQGISKWGGKIPAVLKLPLRDGDEERPGDEAYKNSYFINASAKTKPGIVDRNRQMIFDEEEVYSGCYAYVSVNFYPFNFNGNKGIAAGLNNIMKVADGESLGGRISADVDFDSVEIEYDEDIEAYL